MSHSVLRSLLAKMFDQRWFAILADETRDVSNREKLVLCIRWIFIQLSDAKAETVHKSLRDSLISLSVWGLTSKIAEDKAMMEQAPFKDIFLEWQNGLKIKTLPLCQYTA